VSKIFSLVLILPMFLISCSVSVNAKSESQGYIRNSTDIESAVVALANAGKCDEIWSVTFPLVLEESPEAAILLYMALQGIVLFNNNTSVSNINPPFKPVETDREYLAYDVKKVKQLEKTLRLYSITLEQKNNGSKLSQSQNDIISSFIRRDISFFIQLSDTLQKKQKLSVCDISHPNINMKSCRDALLEVNFALHVSEFEDEFLLAKDFNMLAKCTRRPW